MQPVSGVLLSSGSSTAHFTGEGTEAKVTCCMCPQGWSVELGLGSLTPGPVGPLGRPPAQLPPSFLHPKVTLKQVTGIMRGPRDWSLASIPRESLVTGAVDGAVTQTFPSVLGAMW